MDGIRRLQTNEIGSIQRVTSSFWPSPLVAAFVVLLLCGAPSSALSQPDDRRDEALQQLKAIVSRTHDYEIAAANWKRNSSIIIACVVAIGTMGIAVSILQGFGTTGCKVASVVLGGLVGVFTLVNTTLYPADHRTFGYSALKARPILNELNDLIPPDPMSLSEQVLQARVTKGLRLVKRMEEFEDAIYRTWAASGQPRTSLGQAYAEGEQGTTSREIYTGVGEAASLREARATALTLAVGSASEALAAGWSRGKEQVDPYAVRPFVEKILDLVNDDVAQAGKLVRYTVTIRLPSEFARDRWSGTFGLQSTPPAILSGERVFMKVASPESRGSLGREASARQYVGVVAGESGLELALVAPERAAGFGITLADADGDNRVIGSGATVRIVTGEGSVAMKGPVAIVSRGEDRQVFNLRRVTGVSARRDELHRNSAALWDGDAVEIASSGKPLQFFGRHVVQGGGSSRLVVTLVRASKLAEAYGR